MVLAKEGLQGRAACQLGSLQGWPAAEKVTKDDGVFVLKPLEHLRAIVFQGAGEPMGDPHFVANHTPAVFNELCQSTHGGALRLEGLQLVAVRAEQCELQFGISGVILRATGGKRFAVPCEGQGVDGKEHQEVVCAQGKDDGAFVEFEADGDRFPLEALVEHPTPQWLLVCGRDCRALVARSPQLVSTHHVWHRPSRGRRRPQMFQALLAACVLSQCVVQWCEGTCELVFCEGIIGSR